MQFARHWHDNDSWLKLTAIDLYLIHCQPNVTSQAKEMVNFNENNLIFTRISIICTLQEARLLRPALTMGSSHCTIVEPFHVLMTKTRPRQFVVLDAQLCSTVMCPTLNKVKLDGQSAHTGKEMAFTKAAILVLRNRGGWCWESMFCENKPSDRRALKLAKFSANCIHGHAYYYLHYYYAKGFLAERDREKGFLSHEAFRGLLRCVVAGAQKLQWCCLCKLIQRRRTMIL